MPSNGKRAINVHLNKLSFITLWIQTLKLQYTLYNTREIVKYE